ncbi:MAG: hypothetical protein AAFX40_18050, partial [Cyanobacteria bacterium J06639_1]
MVTDNRVRTFRTNAAVDRYFAIASRFSPEEPVKSVQPCGEGLINDTYLVKREGTAPSFILQRLNTQVFQKPERVMNNLRVFTTHARDRLCSYPLGDRRWEVPQVLSAGKCDFW